MIGTMPARLEIDHRAITEFCRHRHIVEMSLFGSVIRDDFGPESDVDVLVTFGPDDKSTLFDHVHMKDELETIFGREVDLVSRTAIEKSKNWIRRRAILEGAERIYAA